MTFKPHSAGRSELMTDLMLVAALIALVAIARVLPHLPNFTPVVAAALFAGTYLRHRTLALSVPVVAMLVSDAIVGFDNPAMSAVIYASLVLPALAGIMVRRTRHWMVLPATAAGCSLLFFATSNFAVWAFSGMYSLDMTGLVQCYIAALPFLQYSLAGDMFWFVVLFGGAALIQTLSARRRSVSAAPARPRS